MEGRIHFAYSTLIDHSTMAPEGFFAEFESRVTSYLGWHVMESEPEQS